LLKIRGMDGLPGKGDKLSLGLAGKQPFLDDRPFI